MNKNELNEKVQRNYRNAQICNNWYKFSHIFPLMFSGKNLWDAKKIGKIFLLYDMRTNWIFS